MTSNATADPPVHSERPWLSAAARAREAEIVADLDLGDIDTVDRRVHELIKQNSRIHDQECINLNPASNVMNPRAEALLAAGLTTRASLGHPGDKYEMGLEAIEEIEVIAAETARAVFDSTYVELRIGSGALANLSAFMATCEPGDSIIVPSPEIGGHVTHRRDGAAGWYGLDVHECPADPASFSVDLDALADLAEHVRPRLITAGTSLNLVAHPIDEIRAIAEKVGARLLFDAAHACGMIAGGVWPNPLDQGADLMTMSTYKSLGGPAGGLVCTNDAELAARLDAIAYPGLTANFDVARTAALAITLLDWLAVGPAYATAMVDNAVPLAAELERLGLPVYRTRSGPTTSHQLAIDATFWGGGHEAARQLRAANLLACAIGLPGRGEMAGLRLGTPEVTRIGMTPDHMPELASLIADGLSDPTTAAAVALRTSRLRRQFDEIAFVRS